MCPHLLMECIIFFLLLFSDTDEVSGDVGITDDKKVILERVRMNTRREYLEGGGTSSVRATDRLMRELQDIYRSKSLKDGKNTGNFRLEKNSPLSPLLSWVKFLSHEFLSHVNDFIAPKATYTAW